MAEGNNLNRRSGCPCSLFLEIDEWGQLFLYGASHSYSGTFFGSASILLALVKSEQDARTPSRYGYLILNPVDKSIKNCRVGIAHLDSVGIAHPTIAQLVFQDLFQAHSVS
jgi:hypothetical protein